MGPLAERKQRCLNELERLAPEACSWSDAIHARPELGNAEHFASELLTTRLKAAGFAVEKGVAGLVTAFRAAYYGSGEGPIVGLFAEYDALPELGHACGHNVIGAAATLAGIAVSRCLDGLQGGVMVLGCPAEETMGGKVTMLERGAFKDLSVALLAHPAGVHMLGHSSLAMDALEFSFRGRAAHASAAPHEGVNALEAVINLFMLVNSLRQHLPQSFRVHGIITEGGVAANVVPERAVARFYVRAPFRRELNRVAEQVRNCAKAAALASGTELTIQAFEPPNDNMNTNHTLAEAMRKNLNALGVWDITPPGQASGSSDFGNVSHVVPALPCFIAISQSVLTHTPAFAAAAGGPGGHAGLVLAAKALALTALDVIGDRDLLERVREEFSLSQEE